MTTDTGGLHQTFASVALRSPDTVALACGDRDLTYAELDQISSRWAVGLIEAGVRPGDLVPVVLPRGRALVVALLAVLKAGAAYALLDPAWPLKRLQAMVDLLSAPVVLSWGQRVTSSLGGRSPATMGGDPRGFEPFPAAPSDPCCVFFTSGTTGVPKGVVSPHSATARLFRHGLFGHFDERTVVPLAAPPAWDAFSFELWAALLHGGTSVLVEAPYLSPDALRRVIADRGANTAWVTSSLLNMVVDEDPVAFAGLRTVVTGGERLSVPHVGRLLRRHPSIQLINGYGPVESTVFATTHPVSVSDCDRPSGIPIGRPVPGTGVHVLEGIHRCPAGREGEICISGEGLALGYLGDPALTKAKFVELPSESGSVRVYRTGDLGSVDADGLLHYHGRADRQIKIRGHRIEPAEVERQIEEAWPSVRSCRVIARRDALGAYRDMVAFCVPECAGDALEAAEQVLRTTLVAYQRPSAVVSLDAFPLTPRGKLDEPAMLALAPPLRANARSDSAPPDDGLLATVRAVFSSVLGVGDVPADQPFADLGATSLDMGRACARLSDRLLRPVPLSWLYSFPSAESLSRRLALIEPGAPRARPVELPHGVPLTAMQRLFLTRTLIAPTDRTGHCLVTWILDGPLDREALESAIASVHGRHEALRSSYRPDPRPLSRPVAVPPPDLEVLPAAPSISAGLSSLRRNFDRDLDLSRGKIWRVALVPVPAVPVTLFGCLVHHIAFDGWSESVLAADLSEGYRMAARGDARPVESAPTLSELHADREARCAKVDPTQARASLIQELAGVPDLRWPGPRTRAAPDRPSRFEVHLPPAYLEAVDRSATAAGVTPFVVLLAHWSHCLARVAGQTDFCIGVPVRQREGTAVERAIGCHINMLCLRLRGDALRDDELAVIATGRAVRRALASQDVPLNEILLDLARPATGRPPLFQTLFAFQDNPSPRLEVAPAKSRFVRTPYLDLPLELHAEVWVEAPGMMRLEVSHRPEAVPRQAVDRLKRLFEARMNRTGLGSATAAV